MTASSTPTYSPRRRAWFDEKRRDLVEVATAREYRAFTTNGPRADRHYWNPAIDPSGRLLVLPEENGLGFWEPASGAKLGTIPRLWGRSFFDGSGVLWTYDGSGLLRRPVRWGVDGTVHLGPPDRLATPVMVSHDLRASSSLDGQVVAVANYEGAVVLHRDRPGRGIWLGPQADCRQVAVSPDGRYVLTGTHASSASTVWDARSGRRLKAFDGDGQVGFIGDGLQLLAAGRFWRLGSWETGPAVDFGGSGFAEGAAPSRADRERRYYGIDYGGGDFAEGAGLLACGTGPVVSLVSVATGHAVARLEDPNQEVATYRSCTPDGTRLFTTSRQSESIHAWDLRLIRRRLAELDLDWHAPPFPPEAPGSTRRRGASWSTSVRWSRCWTTRNDC